MLLSYRRALRCRPLSRLVQLSRLVPLSPLVLPLAVLSLAGCSGDDVPELGQVAGVVMQAGQPSENALVEFYPETGRPSLGRTGPDGHYTLIYTPGNNGALVGSHTVRITPGTIVAPNVTDGVDREMAPMKVDASSGVLTWPTPAVVTTGDNTFDFDLANASTKTTATDRNLR